jgi:hypothetical protein
LLHACTDHLLRIAGSRKCAYFRADRTRPQDRKGGAQRPAGRDRLGADGFKRCKPPPANPRPPARPLRQRRPPLSTLATPQIFPRLPRHSRIHPQNTHCAGVGIGGDGGAQPQVGGVKESREREGARREEPKGSLSPLSSCSLPPMLLELLPIPCPHPASLPPSHSHPRSLLSHPHLPPSKIVR